MLRLMAAPKKYREELRTHCPARGAEQPETDTGGRRERLSSVER
jgi:hypothetical protein